MERPILCMKRGCYIQPKMLFPEWNKLNIACNECPYLAPEKEPEKLKKLTKGIRA